MILKIMMAAAGLFGTYWFLRINDKSARILQGLLVLSIAISLLPFSSAFPTGVWGYTVTLPLIFIYASLKKEFNRTSRTLFGLITLPIFIASVFYMNHWPYAGILSLTMPVPLLSMAYLLRKGTKPFREELGLLVILAMDAVIRLLITVGGLLS